MRSKAEVGESKQGSASRSRVIFLVGTPGDDLERIIRQRPSQRPRLIPWRAHPHVAFFLGDQDKCSHSTAINADQWLDHVRLSDLEARFVCKACGKRGADVRPDFNWNENPVAAMGYR